MISSGIADCPGLCHRREKIGLGIQSFVEAHSIESLANIDHEEAAPKEATVGEEEEEEEEATAEEPTKN